MQVGSLDELLLFLDRYREGLLRFGGTRLADPAEAEDALQELFLWALPRLRGGAVFNTFYLKLRFQSLLRSARRQASRTRCVPGSMSPDDGFEEPLASASPEASTAARALLARVLYEEDGALVLAACANGVAETAEALGESANWLHQRIHRFRRRSRALADAA